MKYVLFIYGGNCYLTKDDLSFEYFMFEERFGSPMTSGTFEEMVKYSEEFQSRRQFK
jgi:hypothetical protein